MQTPCVMCGYEITGTLGERCPECGVVHDEGFKRITERRRDTSECFPATCVKHVSIFLGLILTCAIGLAVGFWDYKDGIAITLMLGFGSSLTLAMGLALTMLAPKHTKRLHKDLWVRHLWTLHLPWMSIPGFTTLGAIVALLTVSLAPDLLEPVLFLTVGVCFVCWLVVVVSSLMLWFARAGKRRVALALHETPLLTTAHALAAVVTWMGCAFVGFFGGISGTGIILTLIEWGWDF